MRQFLERRLSDARGIWCITTAGVFTYLAVSGAIPPEDVLKVVLVLLGFYFARD